MAAAYNGPGGASPPKSFPQESFLTLFGSFVQQAAGVASLYSSSLSSNPKWLDAPESMQSWNAFCGELNADVVNFGSKCSEKIGKFCQSYHLAFPSQLDGNPASQRKRAQNDQTGVISQISSHIETLKATLISFVSQKSASLSSGSSNSLSSTKPTSLFAAFALPAVSPQYLSLRCSKVDKKNRIVYLGGDQLVSGRITSSRLEERLKGKPNGEVWALRALENGGVLAQYGEKWDIVYLDSELGEKLRLEGEETGGRPAYFKSIRLKSGGEGKYALWLSGHNSVTIVDTEDFSCTEIKYFWTYHSSKAHPVAAIVDSKGESIIAISDTEHETQLLHFYTSGDKVNLVESERIIGKTFLTSLELSHDDKFCFLGGAEDAGQQTKGDCCLYAIMWRNGAQVVQKACYPYATTGFGLITVLSRHPKADILFLGTQTSIGVVCWNGSEFGLLSKVENMSTKPITDLCFFDESVFAVADDTIATIISFNQHQGNRDPRLNLGRLNEISQKKKVLEDQDQINIVSNVSKPPGATPFKPSDQTSSDPSYTGLHSGGEVVFSGPSSHFQPPIYVSSPSMQNKPRISQKDQFSNPKASFVVSKDLESMGQLSEHPFELKKLPVVEFDFSKESIFKGDISTNGQLICFGKECLHRLLQKEKHFLKLRPSEHIKPFLDIRILASGEVVIYEENSFDLIKCDPALKEIKRLKGSPLNNIIPGLSVLNTTKIEEYFLWMRGPLLLSLVNTATFEFIDLKLVYAAFSTSRAKVKAALYDHSLNTVISLVTENTSDAIVTHYISTSRSVVAQFASVVFSPRASAFCCEITPEDKLLVIGGTSERETDSTSAEAVLWVADLERGMELRSQLSLKSVKGENRRAVMALKKSPKRNIFFAGTFRDVFLLDLTAGRLSVLYIVDELHNWMVTNIAVKQDYVLVTSQKDDRLSLFKLA